MPLGPLKKLLTRGVADKHAGVALQLRQSTFIASSSRLHHRFFLSRSSLARGLGDISTQPTARMSTQENSNKTTDAEVEALRAQVEELKVRLKGQEAAARQLVAPYSKSFGRTMIATVLDSEGQGVEFVGRTIRIGGWVKTGREAGAGAFAFLEVNDGSCFANLQIMVDAAVAQDLQGGLKALVPTATCVLIEGILSETPPGTKQKVELKAQKVLYVGTSDGAEYPLAKKKQSLEFLREKAHLRARTNTIGAVARIRNALAYATHTFFQERGFLYVHTPIITAADCEGAGEMFQVTTLLASAEENQASNNGSDSGSVTKEALETLRARVEAQGQQVKKLKEEKAPKEEIQKEVATLLKAKEELKVAEEAARCVGGIYRTVDGKIDYSRDFFSRPAYLTVSGQLNGEYYACGLSNVYTFGPTFRAENSHTARHLAEFWMIEPEMAFCNLEDDMNCAEDYVRFCCIHLLRHCRGDLEFITKMIDPDALSRLEQVASTPFKRVSYTEAVELLEAAVKSGAKTFEFPVSWGVDLQSEHERYLTEEIFKQPVIVYNYPKDIKAFYMKLNEDAKTVAAMDVLVPRVGELIGGSQREDRLDVLTQRIQDAGMPLEAYAGYLDLRRYGTVPHSGFGLGFERLILFATGMENIRDVIPFPRWPGRADY